MRELSLKPISGEEGELLFRVAHVCDLHLNPSREIPRSRTETYHADSVQELTSLFSALEADSVSLLAVSGDLFNLKNPAKYHAEDYITLSDVFTKGLVERGIKLATIPGNHDLPNSSLDNIDKSPYRVFTRLMGGCDVSAVDTSYLYKAEEGEGSFKVSVMVSGVPFHPYEHILEALREHDSKLALIPNTIHIVLLHPDALPYEEPNYHFQVHTYQEICDAMPHATVLCLGHIHQGYPVYVSKANPETKKGIQFISKPFSMGRVVKDYFVSTEILEERHIPSYALVEIRQKEGKLTVSVEYKAVDHVPFEHAFKKEGLREELERSVIVSSFVENLTREFGSARNAFEITQTGDQILGSLDVPKEIATLVEEYLNNA